MRSKIEQSVKKAVHDLYGMVVEVEIQHPPSQNMGDYSTNIAFLLAKKVKNNPQEIANKIANEINYGVIESATNSSGFVNIKIKKEDWIKELEKAISPEYGYKNWKKGERILIEFVSANPTGPLTLAHARAAAFGDSLARIFESQGVDVDREYYINDSGSQIKNLGESLQLKIKELQGETVQYSRDTYKGDYIEDLAKKAKERGITDYKNFGVEEILKIIKKTLKRFRVRFDNWVSESKIKESGKADRIIEDLKKVEPYPFEEKEGALWFTPGERGRVFTKSDRSYTYIVPDIAYHRYKFDRGYDKLIDLLGPDHIDHIPELKKSLDLLGYPSKDLEIKIIQWVTLKRGNEVIKMSKRSGEFITIDELLDEIGVDAARFFYLMRKSSVPMDFDLELAKEESERNPVYYVQYGYARISSLLDLAREKGYPVDLKEGLALLSREEEWKLIKKIPEFKEVLEDAVEIREPHLLAYYLLDLSKLYHNFYQRVRIIGGEEELIEPRLFLSNAVKNVLKEGLELLGVTTPERM